MSHSRTHARKRVYKINTRLNAHKYLIMYTTTTYQNLYTYIHRYGGLNFIIFPLERIIYPRINKVGTRNGRLKKKKNALTMRIHLLTK